MYYSIYDKDGEFIDIICLTEQELKAYKLHNPLHSVELTEDSKGIEDRFLVQEEIEEHFPIEED